MVKQRHDNAPNELPGEPEERFFEVVVGLRGDLEVLEVFLAVEGDRASLDFSVLKAAILDQREIHRLIVERTLTSTLLPQRTIGMFSHTRSRSRCQLGTFL